MAEPIATCVWTVTPALLVALHDRFGPPAHAYDNGSQTWLRDDGPGEVLVEWRLHPRAELPRPGRRSGYHLFPAVAGVLARGDEPELDPGAVWSGLEAAPAYDEPRRRRCPGRPARGRARPPPEAWGPLDRDELARSWERSLGHLDVVAWALDQLTATG